MAIITSKRNIKTIPAISVFIFLFLEFFRFYQYIADITKHQYGKYKYYNHGFDLNGFKKLDGFVKKDKANKACQNQINGHHIRLFAKGVAKHMP
jgi:hypothetical protein